MYFNTLSRRCNHFIWIQEEFSSPTEWLLNPEIKSKFNVCRSIFFLPSVILMQSSTGRNAKIVVLKKTTLQLYFKTFIEKINSGNLIM